MPCPIGVELRRASEMKIQRSRSNRHRRTFGKRRCAAHSPATAPATAPASELASALTRALTRALVCLALLCTDTAAATQLATLNDTADNSSTYRLNSIQIRRQNIFGERPARIVARAINRLHTVTQEQVIAREIWFAVGDLVSINDARELERLIRELGLFARVSVSLQALASSPDTADIIISTEDRLSIIASAGGSFLGGIGEVEFSVGDKNLFGLGHLLEFGYSQSTDGGLRGSVAYDNVLISGSDVYAGGRLGQTEEGEFAQVQLANRFQNSNDTGSWSIEVDHQTTRIDFFEQGSSVAEVPRARQRVRTNWLQRSPITRAPADDNSIAAFSTAWRYGPVFHITNTSYDAAIGPAAASIDVPEDSLTLFVGALVARDGPSRYRKETFLDTLSFEQDIVLGNSVELLLGAEHESTSSTNSTRGALFVSGSSHNTPSAHTFVNAAVDVMAVSDGRTLDSWSVSAGVTGYYTGLPTGTIATRLRYTSAANNSGIDPQQSLGESNGLRGYPANEFNGEQRMLLNVEYRLPTHLEFFTLELASLLFLDSGWVGERGNNRWLKEPRRSIGAGIRVGSPALLGSSVVRLDLAYPFDDDPTRDFGPTISLAVGQTFGVKP